MLPPLCTDLYTDLEVEGDLADDRFVAEAQVLRSTWGWPSSEEFVSDLLAGLEDAAAYRGPYTDEEWASLFARTSDPERATRIVPESVGAVSEWLRLNGTNGFVYFTSASTVTVAYPEGAGSDFLAVLAEAKEAVESQPPNDEHFEVTWREVDYSWDELNRRAGELSEAINGLLFEPDPRANRLPVDLGVDDRSDIYRIPAELLPFVCLVAPRPEGDFGPQPASGEGWRMLAISDNGLVVDSLVARSQVEIEQLWLTLSIPDLVPEVDFETEAVVLMEVSIGIPCGDWFRLDRVELSSTGDQMVGAATEFLYPFGCLGVGGVRRFVVAVETNGLTGDFVAGDVTVTRVEVTG